MRIVLTLMLVLLGCQKAPPSSPARTPPAPPPTGTSAVTWELGFDPARTTADDTGWRVKTDTGYDVHVSQGVLTTWRLSLTKCPPPTAWSLFPAAYANHYEPPDPTSILPHLAEDLARPQAKVVTRQVPPAKYCQGYWLVSAPPPAESGDGPRISLQLHATWQKGDAKGAFALETWLPDAKMQPVPGLDGADGATTITVTRKLGDIFDGVDLATAPTQAMAWTVLHKLVAGATWRVK